VRDRALTATFQTVAVTVGKQVAESERLKAEQGSWLRRADLLVLYVAGALSAGAG
jgi:hypothetical protein